jgi:hypothetical protein
VRILIDGIDFRELARRHEAPIATAAGTPELAGAYEYRSTTTFSPDLFYGKDPTTADDNPNRVTLMGCGCGVIECWPLLATIDVRDQYVRWHSFRQPHRPAWRYDGFGPFAFDRSQYDRAIADGGTQFTQVATPASRWRERASQQFREQLQHRLWVLDVTLDAYERRTALPTFNKSQIQTLISTRRLRTECERLADDLRITPEAAHVVLVGRVHELAETDIERIRKERRALAQQLHAHPLASRIE